MIQPVLSAQLLSNFKTIQKKQKDSDFFLQVTNFFTETALKISVIVVAIFEILVEVFLMVPVLHLIPLGIVDFKQFSVLTNLIKSSLKSAEESIISLVTIHSKKNFKKVEEKAEEEIPSVTRNDRFLSVKQALKNKYTKYIRNQIGMKCVTVASAVSLLTLYYTFPSIHSHFESTSSLSTHKNYIENFSDWISSFIKSYEISPENFLCGLTNKIETSFSTCETSEDQKTIINLSSSLNQCRQNSEFLSLESRIQQLEFFSRSKENLEFCKFEIFEHQKTIRDLSNSLDQCRQNSKILSLENRVQGLEFFSRSKEISEDQKTIIDLSNSLDQCRQNSEFRSLENRAQDLDFPTSFEEQSSFSLKSNDVFTFGLGGGCFLFLSYGFKYLYNYLRKEAVKKYERSLYKNGGYKNDGAYYVHKASDELASDQYFLEDAAADNDTSDAFNEAATEDGVCGTG